MFSNFFKTVTGLIQTTVLHWCTELENPASAFVAACVEGVCEQTMIAAVGLHIPG
jgi:hypothetical protein